MGFVSAQTQAASQGLYYVYVLFWTFFWNIKKLSSILGEKENVNNNSPVAAVEGISWLSVLKLMHGSFRLNRAHDLLLKLMPWKQASDMLFPRNSIVPPRTVPNEGRGKCIVFSCKPATYASTFCQWRWCLASLVLPVWLCTGVASRTTEKIYIYKHCLKKLLTEILTFLRGYSWPRRPCKSTESPFATIKLLGKEFFQFIEHFQ